ncbi:MAG TPA: thioredoxin family protein, partial [Niastella sp.]|nr:thioredoxin family protein [Niastella sp.]
MNRLVVLILLWCCSFTGSFAQEATGLPLASSWNNLLKRAAQNNKPILIHVSAQWCGFCEKMDKETFADAEVRTRLSQSFIAAAVDDSSSLGRFIAMKYAIRSFPTYLVLNSKGFLVMQEIGFKKKQDFLSLIQSARKAVMRPAFKGYSNQLDQQLYQPFYRNMYEPAKKQFCPEEVAAYLNTQQDLFSEPNWVIMAVCKLTRPYNDFFISKIDKYAGLYGWVPVRKKLAAVCNDKILAAAKTANEKELQYVMGLVKQYFEPAEAGPELARHMQSFYLNSQQYTKLLQLLEHGTVAVVHAPMFVYNITVQKDVEDEVLSRAETLMRTLVAQDASYNNLTVLAHVLYTRNK